MLLQIFVITNMARIQQEPFFGTELGEPSDVYCRNIVLDGVGVGTTWSVDNLSIASGGAFFKADRTVVVISPTTVTGSGTGMEVAITIDPYYNIASDSTANTGSFASFSMYITTAGSNYAAGDTLRITNVQLAAVLGPLGWPNASFSTVATQLDFKLGNNVTVVQNEVLINANGGGRADVNRGETGWQFSVGAANKGFDATINLIIPAKSDTSSNQIDYTADTYDVVASITGTNEATKVSDTGKLRTAIYPRADGSTWISIMRDAQTTLGPGFVTVRLVKRNLTVQ
jgi:hypothetical protein